MARSLLGGSVAVVAVVVALALVAPCAAWGGDGHRIVAQIATEFLTPAAAKAVAQQVRAYCGEVALLLARAHRVSTTSTR